jgi:hypothetical protein
MPRGWANEIVGEINPRKVGYCHPAQSKRTKCACGETLEMHTVATRCGCGRVHRKDPFRSAFADTGPQPVRPGGKNGCPGCPE